MTTAEEFYLHYIRTGTPGWYDRLGILRQAIIKCDGPAVLDILRSRCVIDQEDPGGCWMWVGAKRSGYGFIGRGPTNRLAHRVSWEAARSFTQELGALSVHHKCGRRLCVNPQHLAAVTHLENNAEMMRRQFYEGRIAALEDALRMFDPNHELLTRLPKPLEPEE
ncbi:HNH endonuclease [Arthrobacter sp. PAMC25284]|uniref:HNH endonuclease n=1 Tax=Arthrobacter sp. PAMC25284 TaxID=2861279 RepID=UPI001C62DD58|nr:HNH endonuclease [Arthrobacter sp. PAMC25284]QYF88495.1 HNH endonuclease [Arthrobacter sp. PAMC25284]